jgi:hypothetical protein
VAWCYLGCSSDAGWVRWMWSSSTAATVQAQLSCATTHGLGQLLQGRHTVLEWPHYWRAGGSPGDKSGSRCRCYQAGLTSWQLHPTCSHTQLTGQQGINSYNAPVGSQAGCGPKLVWDGADSHGQPQLGSGICRSCSMCCECRHHSGCARAFTAGKAQRRALAYSILAGSSAWDLPPHSPHPACLSQPACWRGGHGSSIMLCFSPCSSVALGLCCAMLGFTGSPQLIHP